MGDRCIDALSKAWLIAANTYDYSHHFQWLGVKVVQYPGEIVAMQELIWRTKPDLIIETGIAHGGMLIFYASMLELIGGDGVVVGIDILIRPENRTNITSHPLAKRVNLIEKSSLDPDIGPLVAEIAAERKRVLVCLDSNHVHDHVLRELEIYSPLVKQGSYIVVFDTCIEDFPDGSFPERPWGPNNNPKTAVREFLRRNDRFVIDTSIQDKLLVTTNPDGYLLCVRD